MVETIERVNAFIGDLVWGPPLLLLIAGTGLYLTFRLGFLQFRRPGLVVRSLLAPLSKASGKEGGGALNAFQAASSAVAATVGVGNIAGVSTAIYLGGPGALFWMWVIALVGMATKYAEVVLGMKYRETSPETGEVSGGPMFYMARGVGSGRLAVVYAFLTGVAAMGIGNMVQANTIAVSIQEMTNVGGSVTGLVILVLVAVVVIGGVKRIGLTAQFLVPIMATVYLAAGAVILVQYAGSIPSALATIVKHAFMPAAAAGGWAGATVAAAIRYGFARGVFSNEAGLGSAAIIHSQARNTPVGQGMWGIFEVAFDTLVVATMTGLVIVVTGVLETADVAASGLAAEAFERGLPGFGRYVVFASLVLFAYSTMLTWCFYGEQAWQYLFGPRIVTAYRVVFLAFIYIGAVGALELVWAIADTLNGLMAIPNLVALILLARVVVAQTKAELGES